MNLRSVWTAASLAVALFACDDGDGETADMPTADTGAEDSADATAETDAGLALDAGADMGLRPPVTEGLVAWLPLDGHTDDHSGHGHHGEPIGAFPTADRHGDPTGAMGFDGDDAIVVTDHPAFDIGDADFSLSLWFKSDGGDYEGVLSQTSGVLPEHGWWITVRAGDEDPSVQFWMGGAGHVQAHPIEIGAWVHLALVRQGSAVRFYVDGERGPDIDHDKTVWDSETDLKIGLEGSFYIDHYLVGAVDGLPRAAMRRRRRRGADSPGLGPEPEPARWSPDLLRHPGEAPVVRGGVAGSVADPRPDRGPRADADRLEWEPCPARLRRDDLARPRGRSAPRHLAGHGCALVGDAQRDRRPHAGRVRRRVGRALRRG